MPKDRMRWDCKKDGCYRDICPKLSLFDECFTGRNCLGDIDGILERKGHFLLVEWKSPGGHLSTGQRIMFNRMAELPNFAVFVLYGSNTGEIEEYELFYKCKHYLRKSTSLAVIKKRFTTWECNAINVRSHRTKET